MVAAVEGMPELEVLIKGMLDKGRILDIIRNFITFSTAKDEVVKYGYVYQYYGVTAVEETIRATAPEVTEE